MKQSQRIKLIRLAADGELSKAERLEFEEQLTQYPEDQKVVESEQALRQAVDRSMRSQDAAAPADLPNQVRAALVPEKAIAGRVDASSSARTPQQRQSWTRFIVAPSGLAAGILILVGVAAVVSSVYSSRFNSDSFSNVQRTAIMDVIKQTDAGLLTADVDSSRYTANSLGTAQAVIELRFGETSRFAVGGLDYSAAGVKFVGLRESSLIADGVNLVYRDQESGDSLLTMWAIPNDQVRGHVIGLLKSGTAYELSNGDSLDTFQNCYAWVGPEFTFLFRMDDAESSPQRMLDIAHVMGMPAGKPVRIP